MNRKGLFFGTSHLLPKLILIALLLTFATTPAFATIKLLLLEPIALHGGDTEPYRDLKICLVVKDARNASVVETQMCGYSGKGSLFYILQNPETLDAILAYSIADCLEFAGYEVVKVYPGRLAGLSNEAREIPKQKEIKADIKEARSSEPKNAQAETKAISDLGEFGESISFSRVSGNVTAQGGAGWTNGADAVLEITIEKFSSGIKPNFASFGVYAWSMVTLAIAPGESGHRGTLDTTEVFGWGSATATAFGPPKVRKGAKDRGMQRVSNASYRRLVNKIEALFLSDEFFTTLEAASRTPQSD